MEPRDISPKHRAFAEALASGLTATEAYLQAGYQSRSRKVAQRSACRLRRHPAVIAHLAEIRRHAADTLATSDTVLTVAEKLAILARIVKTSAKNVEPGSDLCQGYRVSAGGAEFIRMPCKLRAMLLHSRYSGDLEPQPAAKPCTLPPSADRPSSEEGASAHPISPLPASPTHPIPPDEITIPPLPYGAGLYVPPPRSQNSEAPAPETSAPPNTAPAGPPSADPPPLSPVVAHRRAVLAEVAKPAPPPWEADVLKLAPELYNCRPNGRRRVTVIR